ncbi:MAG: hypothetical protein JRH11_03170 [Deltaproteobacteria bacterium]|nr:hypothetical protein [Deltaproteobacteria bacterium]
MPRPRIEVPDAAGDRPNPGVIAATAVVALAVGLGLVRWTLIDEPVVDDDGAVVAGEGRDLGSGRHLAGVEAENVETESGQGVAAVDFDSAQPTNLDSERSPGPEVEPQNPQEARNPEADPSPAPPPPHRVLPGRVAYLRCEGARPTGGPFPCPRDRDLERAIWAALGALAECPGRPVAAGEGDLRLAFSGGNLQESSLRETGEGGLPEAAVLGCLEEPLGALTTTIRAEELLVSFRFVLEPR